MKFDNPGNISINNSTDYAVVELISAKYASVFSN